MGGDGGEHLDAVAEVVPAGESCLGTAVGLVALLLCSEGGGGFLTGEGAGLGVRVVLDVAFVFFSF